jgi:hypothetical protein
MWNPSADKYGFKASIYLSNRLPQNDKLSESRGLYSSKKKTDESRIENRY